MSRESGWQEVRQKKQTQYGHYELLQPPHQVWIAGKIQNVEYHQERLEKFLKALFLKSWQTAILVRVIDSQTTRNPAFLPNSSGAAVFTLVTSRAKERRSPQQTGRRVQHEIRVNTSEKPSGQDLAAWIEQTLRRELRGITSRFMLEQLGIDTIKILASVFMIQLFLEDYKPVLTGSLVVLSHFCFTYFMLVFQDIEERKKEIVEQKDPVFTPVFTIDEFVKQFIPLYLSVGWIEGFVRSFFVPPFFRRRQNE